MVWHGPQKMWRLHCITVTGQVEIFVYIYIYIYIYTLYIYTIHPIYRIYTYHFMFFLGRVVYEKYRVILDVIDRCLSPIAGAPVSSHYQKCTQLLVKQSCQKDGECMLYWKRWWFLVLGDLENCKAWMNLEGLTTGTGKLVHAFDIHDVLP